MLKILQGSTEINTQKLAVAHAFDEESAKLVGKSLI